MEIIKYNYKYFIVIGVVVVLLFVSYFLYVQSNEEIEEEPVVLEKKNPDKTKQDEVKEITDEEIQINEAKNYLYIDIKGAVNNPNVYMIEDGKRVIDAINAAGGLKEDADTSILNLSKKLTDEMYIIVYTKNEIEQYKNQKLNNKEILEKLEEELLIVDDYNDAKIKTQEAKKDVTSEMKISINTATKEQLLTINGIGESKADSIIKYREENGRFKTIEEVKNVSGIGDSLFEKIKDYITI